MNNKNTVNGVVAYDENFESSDDEAVGKLINKRMKKMRKTTTGRTKKDRLFEK